jgi:hypothetical protein
VAINRVKGSLPDLPPWLVGQCALFLALAVVLGILAPWKTPEFRGSCVSSNEVDSLGPRVYENHKTVTVTPGTIVTVQLGTGEGSEWPWHSPVSSNQAVLKPISLCANPPHITTIPIIFIPFKAIAPGRATVTAVVFPNGAATFDTFTLTVIVKPR